MTLARLTTGLVRIVFSGLVMACFVLAPAGCRTWPDDDGPAQPITAEGSYVGSGNLDGGPTNILLVVIGPDTAGRYTGSIRYRAAITAFEDVFRTVEGDTLWLRYRRNNSQYRAWAVVGGNGLVVHFVEPVVVPSFRLNREIAGYNLTGLWNGTMSSTAYATQASTTMSMDQQGQSFFGTAEAVFFQTTRYELTSGAANIGSFHLTGSMSVGTARDEVLWVGSYVSRDTVSGIWQAGPNGSVDRGEFFLYRPYE